MISETRRPIQIRPAATDPDVLPRAIAGRAAFENAMSLDIAMGGSTNTILHLLAAAFEGDVSFTLEDIDRLSRRVPHLCKVSPATSRYHVEDVHRAGGVVGILGEPDRADLLDTSVRNVLGEPLAETLARWDLRHAPSEEVQRFYLAGPGRRPSLRAFSQNAVDRVPRPRPRRRLHPRGGARL